MKTEADKKPGSTFDPEFNEKLAKPVTLYRCDTTGRTVAFHQVIDGVLLRFSATGVFVSSDTRSEKVNPPAEVQAPPAADPGKQ